MKILLCNQTTQMLRYGGGQTPVAAAGPLLDVAVLIVADSVTQVYLSAFWSFGGGQKKPGMHVLVQEVPTEYFRCCQHE